MATWLVVSFLVFGFAPGIAERAGAATNTTTEIRVSTGDDDAEENFAGRVSLKSSDLELAENRGSQIIGIRFAAVDVPAGATIVDAYVQFAVDERDSGEADLLIRAEAVAQSAVFTKANLDVSSRPLSTAVVGWQPVEWSTVGEAGIDQRTPNISAVVQEVIEQPGWSSGNPVSVIITGTGTRTAESYNGDASAAPLLHVEYTSGPPPNLPPVVTIGSPGAGSIFLAGDPVSFAATALDPEDGDVGASLVWTSDLDGLIGTGPGFASSILSVGSHNVTAQAGDSVGLAGDDAVTIEVVATLPNQPPLVTIGTPVDGATSTAGDVVSFSATAQDPEDGDVSSSLTWTSDLDGLIGVGPGFSITTLTPGTHVVTAQAVDLEGLPGADTVAVTVVADQPPTVVVSAPTNFASFAVGTEITFTASATDLEDGDLSGSLLWTSDVDGPLGGGGTILISTLSLGTHVVTAGATDSLGQTGLATVTLTITDPSQIQSIDVRVAAGADDAEEAATGSVSITSSDLELVESGGAQTVGMRFVGIDVPQGATVVSSWIQFTVDEIDTVATSLVIRAQATDDAPWFTTTALDVSGRPTTTASTIWGPATWDVVGAAGPDQRTSDLAAVIQEVVDRGGWAPGNAIVIVVTGLGVRTAESYNGVAGAAPLLHIEYTDGANQAPMVVIGSPADGASFTEGASVDFSATATDAEDGDVGASLVWTSSLDGPMGTGPGFSATLSPGVHIVTARAVDSLGRTAEAAISVTVAYGDPILVGAGDIAECALPYDEATSDLLDRYPDATVFTLGDNVYDDGSTVQFNDCYDPSWGRQKERTRPSTGNHDYHIPDAAGYFGYFGAAAGMQGEGWYSYDLGSWHIIVLNSNCRDIGGCDAASPQFRWLQADLAAHTEAVCSLAYWHQPRFTSGDRGEYTKVKPLWDLLYAYGADVVLAGNDHFYERQTPQDPAGVVDLERGIRQFIVGTGGTSLKSFTTPPAANTEVRQDTDHGVMFLRLRDGSYDWDFISTVDGGFEDPGSAPCVVAANAAPSVTVVGPGPAGSFTIGDSIVFEGNATDPEDGDVAASLTWSSDLDGVIGSGGLFSTSALTIGAHLVTATATDGQGLAASSAVLVTVTPSAGNGPPTVSAGPDVTVVLGDGATVVGSGSDDGLPDPPGDLTFSWAQTGGGGVASFEAPQSSTSNVSFSQLGTYALTITVFDGELSAADEVVVTVVSGGGVDTVELRVSSSFDDVEEKATGDVRTRSSDLELVFDVSEQVIGIRYRDLPIPVGATITSAYVQFTVDEATSGGTSLEIRAQAADDAGVFSTIDFDVTSRPLTAAATSWSPAVWASVGEAGPDQRTPELAAVIQEVVDRPGWAPGNALVLIVSGSGERVAEAYDGVPGSAALLHIEFTSSAPSSLQAPSIAQAF